MKTREKKWHILFFIIILLQIFPLIYMLSISLKSMDQVFSEPLKLIPSVITLENYKHIWNNVPIIKYIWNTFFISAMVTLGKIITSIMAAYVMTYKEFKGKKIIYSMILITLFVPFTVTMIPNYLTVSKLGILDTSFGVILPQLADALGILLMMQNMRGIPKSLLEVATIDNISETRTLIHLIIPMIKNSIIAMGILFFINSWNEYFWPLIILSSKENYTLSLALQMFISSEGGNNWGITMAIAGMTIIFPIILYIFCQRMIMTSFVKSGIKG